MGNRAATAGFTTRELSAATWPDYQRFFSQGYGWDHCACTAYQGVRVRRGTFAEQRDANLRVKHDLVERGLAHGILVYDGREPVGWCQFGPAGELPIPRKPGSGASDQHAVWRITCFCTLREHRESGVADVALSAAIRAIADSGGGVVKAAPVATLPNDPELDALVRAHGGDAAEVSLRAQERFGATSVIAYDRRAWSVGGVYIHGLGPLWAMVRKVPAMSHTGTVSMFERRGFEATGVIEPGSRKLPVSRLVMERVVRARRGAAARRSSGQAE